MTGIVSIHGQLANAILTSSEELILDDIFDVGRQFCCLGFSTVRDNVGVI